MDLPNKNKVVINLKSVKLLPNRPIKSANENEISRGRPKELMEPICLDNDDAKSKSDIIKNSFNTSRNEPKSNSEISVDNKLIYVPPPPSKNNFNSSSEISVANKLMYVPPPPSKNTFNSNSEISVDNKLVYVPPPPSKNTFKSISKSVDKQMIKLARPPAKNAFNSIEEIDSLTTQEVLDIMLTPFWQLKLNQWVKLSKSQNYAVAKKQIIKILFITNRPRKQRTKLSPKDALLVDTFNKTIKKKPTTEKARDKNPKVRITERNLNPQSRPNNSNIFEIPPRQAPFVMPYEGYSTSHQTLPVIQNNFGQESSPATRAEDMAVSLLDFI